MTNVTTVLLALEPAHTIATWMSSQVSGAGGQPGGGGRRERALETRSWLRVSWRRNHLAWLSDSLSREASRASLSVNPIQWSLAGGPGEEFFYLLSFLFFICLVMSFFLFAFILFYLPGDVCRQRVRRSTRRRPRARPPRQPPILIVLQPFQGDEQHPVVVASLIHIEKHLLEKGRACLPLHLSIVVIPHLWNTRIQISL